MILSTNLRWLMLNLHIFSNDWSFSNQKKQIKRTAHIRTIDLLLSKVFELSVRWGDLHQSFWHLNTKSLHQDQRFRISILVYIIYIIRSSYKAAVFVPRFKFELSLMKDFANHHIFAPSVLKIRNFMFIQVFEHKKIATTNGCDL